jgi:predicted molibdopterin-dependent oxidoreductase YjgC
VLGDLLGAMGRQSSFFLPSEVFASLASANRAFAGLSYDSLGFKGLPLANASSTEPGAPVAVGAA